MDALQLDRVALAGLSWGGMIGMGYACRHPDRIKRLVLMNTAAFHLPAHIRMPWQLRLARLPWIGGLRFALPLLGSSDFNAPETKLPTDARTYLECWFSSPAPSQDNHRKVHVGGVKFPRPCRRTR